MVALALAWCVVHPSGPTFGLDQPSTYRCGTVSPGQPGRHGWLIRNPGPTPLRIRTRFTSGRSGFSLWQGMEHRVEPGGRITVHLAWVAPDRPAAPFSAYAVLRTDDPGRPEVRLAVVGTTGAGRPPVAPDRPPTTIETGPGHPAPGSVRSKGRESKSQGKFVQ